MPSRQLRDGLVNAANAVRRSLVDAGMQSCFADETWMQRESTADEWQDFLEFTGNYVEEVVFSDDVDSILFSDPDGYPWRTQFVRSRVAERFTNFGPVDELFNRPESRHLIELTEPLRTLSRVLERRTPEAIRMYAERNSVFDAARRNELAEQRSLMSQADQRKFANFCFDLMSNRLGNVSRFHGPEGSCLSLTLFGERDRAETGFVSLRVVESSAEERSHMIPFHRALPSNFSVYSTFRNPEEAVLSFRAWKPVIAEIDKQMRGIGWRREASALLESLDWAS